MIRRKNGIDYAVVNQGASQVNRNPRTAALCWVVLSALVSAVLAGCGASEPAPRIPAPPPFVPAVVVVTLGEQGGATTVISTQAGGWTHNGQPFTSGSTVRGENAATYRLTLSGGTWSAAFVSPDPARVQLGTSGDEVTLELQEDGTYQLGSSAVQSGHVVTAGNGNRYELELSASGTWSAEFLAPDPVRLPLGISGDSVNIEMREDGRFWLNDAELRSGHVVRAANGSRYTLALGTDGMWRAHFVQPEPLRVALGASGSTVQVTRLEAGTFELDGTPLWSGEVREVGGARYRFSLGTDGLWSATFVTEPETVHLGAHGGVIRLIRQENGQWTVGDEAIRSGHIVRSAVNGHRYRLTLVDGVWRAEPQPMPIQVVLQGTGGSIVLTQVEDGSYLYEGNPVSSGEVISVGGSNYLLTQVAGGTWRAVRTTVPPGRPDPSEPLTTDALVTYVGVSPRVRLTSDSSTSTREGSILEVNGLEYSVHGLFTHGRADREVTFAEEAHALITNELEDLEVLIGLAESAPSLARTIEQRWDRIADHLSLVFPGEGRTLLGQDAPKERNGITIDYEELIEDIEDVLAALGSSSAFRESLDDGIFSRSRLVDADESDDTFFAVRSATRLGFGWTAATRYGAYSKQERSAASRPLNFASGTEGIGAFAYSPLEPTRTRDLPGSGEALYLGATIAASRESNQAIYTGNIELRVRFASRQVTGLVSDLQDVSGRLWRYSLQEVDTIHLPSARLDSSDGSFEPVSSGTATISFNPLAVRFSPRSLSAEFEGRFVGRGADAGESAIGTWSISSRGNVILAGGFGVESQGTPTRPPPVVRPVTPTPDLGEVAETWLVARPDSDGNIRIDARDSDNDRIELPAAELSANGGAIIVGPRLFEKAREELDEQLTLLDIYVNILDQSTSTALQSRERLWEDANQTLQDNIFGSRTSTSVLLGTRYPSGSSLADRDEEAVERLVDARHALSTSARFRDAVDDLGVFDGALSQSRLDDGDYDFEEIYAAVEYEVEVKYDNTDFGRFGVWAKHVREDALSPVEAATGDQRSGMFAYSQIGQTIYSSGDQNFPRGFNSSYIGRTLAVDVGSDGTAFYDGDISLSVRWRSDRPDGSVVTTVIENLARTDNGGPLLDGNFEVSELIFDGASVRLDDLNRIGFSGTSVVRVRYFDPSRRERSFITGSTTGKFVGYDPSGPRAVIGTWEWGTIEGAFGADLTP